MDSKAANVLDWRAEMVELCRLATTMLRQASTAFTGQQVDALDVADGLGRLLHQRERILTERVVHRTSATSFVLDADRQQLFIPMHLERAAERVEVLIRAVRTMLLEGTPFTDRARREVTELIDGASDLLVHLRDLLITGNPVLRRHVIEAGRALVARADDCATFHQQRLIEGVCASRASSVYLSILDALKGVEWHAREIAQKLEHPTPADLREIAALLEATVSAAAPAETKPADRPTPVGWIP
jgi:Na+/phosphate symporter